MKEHSTDYDIGFDVGKEEARIECEKGTLCFIRQSTKLAKIFKGKWTIDEGYFYGSQDFAKLFDVLIGSKE
jgi:hypothetical protein